MHEKSTALQLAERLEDTENPRLHLLPYAAEELRRLDARCNTLLSALHSLSLASQDSGSTREGMGCYARAAIAAATKD
jgi:hypothetical protein